jgi:glycosyltransferase involved in cell wall biosynthesis
MKEAILMVIPWSPDLPGGVSVVVRNLARVWRSQSIQTTILISDWNNKIARPAVDGNISARVAVTPALSLIGLIKSLFFGPVTLIRTLAILRSQGISTVHFHYASLESLGVAILKRLGFYRGRFVLSFHGTDVRSPISPVETALWKFVFAAADAITACSDSLARHVESAFALPCGRVTTIYNGVDTSIFTAEADDLNLLPISFNTTCNTYIVSVGSFIKRKGHRFLIDAFARVAHIYPSLGLVVIGMNGDQRIPYDIQVKSHGLSHRVCFLVGLKPGEVASVVARASLCVQPSISEPFGMAVIEAGACGICVAASNVGGHVELIENDKTGLLFPPADSERLAATLHALLSNASKKQDMASTFQRKILAEFSWEASAHQYLTAGVKIKRAAAPH